MSILFFMAAKSKPNTRELILKTALNLFNKQGSHKVTTNHIAKALKISPGNLYYHFDNKEHIIRELLSQLIEGFNSLTHLEDQGRSGLDIIADTMKATGDLIFAYRFIYIELAALLARDPVFKSMYNEIKQKRAREFVQLFEFVSLTGAFRQPLAPHERDAIIFIMWTYAEGIVTALHTSDIPVTRDSIHSHFKKIAFIIKAFLQPAIWSELAKKLELEQQF